MPFLNPLLNEIFDSGIFPKNWSESIIITPLHKKGSINDPNNYRGISLIDSICKIFCHILSNRLTIWCDTFGVIDESQAGFRKQYTTSDNIFTLMALCQKYSFKKKGRFYCNCFRFCKSIRQHTTSKTVECFCKKKC